MGKGAFGTVYRMLNPHDNQICAVKELKNLTQEDGALDDEAMMARLAADVEEGVRAGVSGTPTAFLDGRRLATERMRSGETRYGVLKAAIEEVRAE